MALFEGAPNSAGFTRFVGEAGVTVVGVVPSLVRAWRSADAIGEGDWQQVRVVSSTGEPSNRQDSLRLMSRTGYRVPGAHHRVSRGNGDRGRALPKETQDRIKNAWEDMQADLVTLSPQGAHVVADESDHYVHLQQPDVVIDAIQTVVAAAARQGRYG